METNSGTSPLTGQHLTTTTPYLPRPTTTINQRTSFNSVKIGFSFQLKKKSSFLYFDFLIDLITELSIQKRRLFCFSEVSQLKKNIAFLVFVSEVKRLAIFFFQLNSLVAIEYIIYFPLEIGRAHV